MATTVKHKRGTTAPTGGDLAHGELGLDTTNKRAYTSTNGTDIIELGVNPAAEIQANAGIALPDSQKATFGASDDLQIYHDGSHSYINDTGTGDLFIKGDNNLWLRSAADENYIRCDTDGAVWLYYDNVNKLTTTSTGIDVTGTVTANGLTVDGTARINGGASGTDVDVFSVTNDGSTSFLRVQASDLSSSACDWTIRSGASESIYIAPASTNAIKLSSNNDISFYEDTGTTAKFFWDASAESLGIGTSSPATALDVTGTITADGLTVDGTNVVIDVGVQSSETPALEIRGNNNTANGNIIRFNDEDVTTGAGQAIGKIEWYSTDSAAVVADMSAYAVDASPDGAIKFRTAEGTTLADRLVINNLGNVGIGTSSPDAPLTVIGGGVAEFRAGNIGPSSNSAIRISRNDTTVSGGNPLGYLEFGGNDSTSNIDTAFAYISAEATNAHAAGDNPTALTFGVTADNTATTSEAMRIDSSGNVGIGTTSPASPLTISSAVNKSMDAGATGHLEIQGNGYGAAIALDANGVNIYNNSSSRGIIFGINETERVRIDSSGNLLVGKTATGIGTAGVELAQGGYIYGTRNGNSLALNRLTTDGNLAVFQKDGTTVGSIGVGFTDRLFVGTTEGNGCGLSFDGDSNIVRPASSATTNVDAALDLGTTDVRWKDLYLSGGVYVGGTGAANYLDDYEEGTWTPSADYSTTNATAGSTTGVGTYTKVGNTVTVWATLSNINSTGASGDLQISGLPFAAKTNASLAAVCGSVFTQHLTVASGCYNLVVEMQDATSVMRVREMVNGGITDYINYADISDSVTDMRLTLTYEV